MVVGITVVVVMGGIVVNNMVRVIGGIDITPSNGRTIRTAESHK